MLDEENWREEAKSVINDVKNHVQSIEISQLASNDRFIYVNLTTLENETYCIELSSSGFRIVGISHDLNNIDSDEYYETPYSLLSKISASFYQSFADELINKLKVVE